MATKIKIYTFITSVIYTTAAIHLTHQHWPQLLWWNNQL